jgi:tetratricopeptide (TPR) repeat protein
MKKIILLTIILSLNSCGQNEKEIERDEFYKKGINEMKLTILGKSPTYKKAIDYFNQSLKIDPNYTAASYWKSNCEFKSELYVEAIQTTAIALKLNDKNKFNAPLYIISGLSLKINEEKTKAKRQFNKALEIYEKKIKYSFKILDSKNNNFKNLDAIMNKSVLLCYLDRKDDALKFLDSITKNDENKIALQEIEKYINEFNFDENLKEMKLIK